MTSGQQTSNSSRVSRKRKAGDTEIENEATPSTSNKRQHVTPEDVESLHKLFQQEGLLHTSAFSPVLRSAFAEQKSGLFILSPVGKLDRVPPRFVSGRSFTARELQSSGRVHKRARLRSPAGRKGGAFRARQLSNVIARDSTVRDCTSKELEEARRLSVSKALPPAVNSGAGSTPGAGGIFTPPVLQASEPQVPALSESQSIIGGAIAEATKQQLKTI